MLWGKRHSDATVDSLTTERMLTRRPSSNARPGKPPSSGSPFASAQLQLSLRLWMPAPPLGASCSERARATLGMSKSTATGHILINTGHVISGLRTKNPCKFDVKLTPGDPHERQICNSARGRLPRRNEATQE